MSYLDWINVGCSAGTLLASAGMFWVGYANYKLYQQSQRQSEQQQKDFHDLLEGLIISTLLSGPSSTGDFERTIKAFKGKYKGEKKLFEQPGKNNQ